MAVRVCGGGVVDEGGGWVGGVDGEEDATGGAGAGGVGAPSGGGKG